MTKYSVFYHHIREAARERGVSMDDMLREVRSWGIQYVELDRDDFADEAQLRELADQLARCDVQPSSIYGHYHWDHDATMPTENDLLIRQAKVLGCQRIMVIPGFHADMDNQAQCAQEQAQMIAGVKRLSEVAAAQGLTTTIECFDHARSPIATIAGMAAFLEAAPELFVTLETGNFLFSGDDILEAHQRFADRVRHVHLKDRFLPSQAPEATPAGDATTATTGLVMYPCAVSHGHIPMTTVLDRLNRDGYE
ncbi:MAG: sugar phosphate isomerase/epimerase, partial [Clostridia bacterium]|nr:sugar phosphate isomerase/epimerase [Clostridia bacterium]